MPFLVESEVPDPCKWVKREEVFYKLRSGTALLYVPPSFRARISKCGVIKNALIPVPRRNTPNTGRKLFTDSLDDRGVYLMIQVNDDARRGLIDLVLGKNENAGGDKGLLILDSDESIKNAILGVELMVEEEEKKLLLKERIELSKSEKPVNFTLLCMKTYGNHF